MMKRRFLLLFSLLVAAVAANAQDHIFSQFFNAPVYLNPALTGQFEGDLRVNMIYRNQWSAVGKLNYLNASVDYNLPQFGGGVGLMFNRSNEGSAYFVQNSVAATYAYSIGGDSYVLSFGLQAGIANRQIDFSKLIFADQIDPTSGYIPGSTTSAEAPAFNNKYYFDSGVGVNLVMGKFMGGATLQHLNKPDQSFTGTPSNLAMRAALHLSYKLDVDPYNTGDEADKSYVIPSVVMYKQATASIMSFGAEYKRRGVSAGLWYRTDGQGSPNAVVLSLVFDLFLHKDTGEKFRLGLSHDAAVSTMGYSNTNGTSEGSVSYQTTFPGRDSYNKFEGTSRCYSFY
ncbi:PorP/SprF family type IX secretion system membrane protein [Mucilaginibacter sp. AW1-3]